MEKVFRAVGEDSEVSDSILMVPLLQSRWLGRIDYQEGLHLQEKLVAQKINGSRENYLLFLEHSPVYTMGRRRDDWSLGTTSLPHPLYRIGRGGEATYHGPGQLVCYPILDLLLFHHDLHAYLRFLEEVTIKTLYHYKIMASRREGLTGVWAEDRKIASLGIGVRKWISFHGLALNVSGDLTPFEKITPCGIRGVVMTSVEKEGKEINKNFCTPSLEEIATKVEEIFYIELRMLS